MYFVETSLLWFSFWLYQLTILTCSHILTELPYGQLLSLLTMSASHRLLGELAQLNTDWNTSSVTYALMDEVFVTGWFSYYGCSSPWKYTGWYPWDTAFFFLPIFTFCLTICQKIIDSSAAIRIQSVSFQANFHIVYFECGSYERWGRFSRHVATLLYTRVHWIHEALMECNCSFLGLLKRIAKHRVLQIGASLFHHSLFFPSQQLVL